MSACGIGKKAKNTVSNELSANSDKQPSVVDSADTNNLKEADNGTVNKDEKPDASNFKETTVVDNDECSIKLLSMKPHDDGTYVFDVSLENKSDNIRYEYYATDGVINGVCCEPIMNDTVKPGKTKRTEFIFNNFDLPEDLNGASNTEIDFSDIRVTFVVKNFDDGSAEPVAYETVKIYPFGEDKANTYIRPSQTTDNVIMSNDEVTVSIIGYAYHTNFSYAAQLYIQNRTDKHRTLSVSDCRINGVNVDPYFLFTVQPNSSAFKGIEWYEHDLHKAGIDKINDVKMILSICDDEEGHNVLQSEDVHIDTSSAEFKVTQGDYTAN